ncbi:MAG: sensor histidine kinase, partial [Kordiimonas sp.]
LPEGRNGKMADLLMRMDRANADMKRLIETFLFLGRENDVADCGETFDLNDEIQSVIESNGYLLTEETSFVNALHGPLHLQQPEKYVSVILDNLVRNAAQNTMQGRVVIGASHDLIYVEDTGIGFPEGHEKPAPYQTGRSDGMGLGLNIVARICQLQNWQLNIESGPSNGSRVSVFFS